MLNKRVKSVYIVLIIIIISTYFTSGIVFSSDALVFWDWERNLAFLEYARKSIVDYHQIPLWNPYHCGGMPGIAYPESQRMDISLMISWSRLWNTAGEKCFRAKSFASLLILALKLSSVKTFLIPSENSPDVSARIADFE